MSVRTGRIPLPTDPLTWPWNVHEMQSNLRIAGTGLAAVVYWFWYKLNHPHRYIQYKGPDDPFARIRHKRYPAGGFFWGWGNNGLNRDCGLKEWECWTGYTGKEYTY